MESSSCGVFWHVTLRRILPAVGVAAVWILLTVATEMAVTDLYQVRTLAGDTNLGGTVTTADALQMKIYFGLPVDAGTAAWDYNCSGTIETADYLQIKLRFGNAAPACP